MASFTTYFETGRWHDVTSLSLLDEMHLAKGPTTKALTGKIQEEWASNAHARPKINFTWAKEDVRT